MDRHQLKVKLMRQTTQIYIHTCSTVSNYQGIKILRSTLVVLHVEMSKKCQLTNLSFCLTKMMTCLIGNTTCGNLRSYLAVKIQIERTIQGLS